MLQAPTRKFIWQIALTTSIIAVTAFGFSNCAAPDQISSANSAASTATPVATGTCPFGGQTLENGQSVTAYQSASVPFGQTCVSQTDLCTDGLLSSAFAQASCVVGPAANCAFNSTTIASGATVTAYAAATVPYGASCSSVAQVRVCTNGILSGSDTLTSCVPETCGGAVIGGACLYIGGSQQSCDDVCTTHGGYSAATDTYAGKTGNNYNQCATVLTALGVPTGQPGSGPNACGGAAIGCAATSAHWAGVGDNGASTAVYLLCDQAPTTASASLPAWERACACNR